MNGIRCPQCSLVNSTTAVECQQCRFPFSHLPPSAYVSVPATEYEETVGFSAPPPTIGLVQSIPTDNETGRKTHFWYRVYLSVLALLYLAVSAGGVLLVAFGDQIKSREFDEPVLIGAIYAIVGFGFFVPFTVAIFLPRRPANWIVGIVLICIGMTSCCFLPFLIPLMIFWMKPETQAYFGRK